VIRGARRRFGRLDKAEGLVASGSMLCLAHCLALPLLLYLLPAAAGLVLGATWFHAMAVALVVPTALAMFWLGFRQHARLLPPFSWNRRRSLPDRGAPGWLGSSSRRLPDGGWQCCPHPGPWRELALPCQLNESIARATSDTVRGVGPAGPNVVQPHLTPSCCRCFAKVTAPWSLTKSQNEVMQVDPLSRLLRSIACLPD
jgi:hypothetical protein